MFKLILKNRNFVILYLLIPNVEKIREAIKTSFGILALPGAKIRCAREADIIPENISFFNAVDL